MTPLITSNSGRIRKINIANPLTVNISHNKTIASSVHVDFRMFLNQQMRHARMKVPNSGIPKEKIRAHIQAIRCGSGISAKYSFCGSRSKNVYSIQNSEKK